MHSSCELAKWAPSLHGQACRAGIIPNPRDHFPVGWDAFSLGARQPFDGFRVAQPILRYGLSADGIRRLARDIAACMAVILLIPIAALSAELTDKDTVRLAELVRQDCGSCHGLTLKGGLGRPLLPKHLEHYEISVLADVILYGIPQTAMPGWAPILDRHEAEWIADALKEGKIAQ